MAVHFFHCTDGVSFFADQQGLSVTREDEIFPVAMRTAEQVMQRLPSLSDWSGWLVCVHDEVGQMVEVFDFPKGRSTDQRDARSTRDAPSGTAALIRLVDRRTRGRSIIPI